MRSRAKDAKRARAGLRGPANAPIQPPKPGASSANSAVVHAGSCSSSGMPAIYVAGLVAVTLSSVALIVLGTCMIIGG